MATKKRIKKAAETWVPQSHDDVAAAIKQVGDISRDLERSKADMNDEIAAVTEKYQGGIDASKEQLETLQSGIQVWCEANREELTKGGKTKTANFITGNVLWRIRPPSCRIRGEDSVIETLRKLQLARFIRSKDEINKEAMLNEQDAVRGIAGITIVTGVEDFVIEPFEQEVL